MRDLDGKTAVITGAGGGLGSALAAGLAELGCNLALVDVADTALASTAGALAGSNVRISRHVTDITCKEQVAALPGAVLAEHGRVDLLINNAGITYQKSFETHTLEDWERIVGINWWGVLYGCHFFLDALKRSGEGHIVNISSMNAFVGLPTQTSYCATKAAVKLLSEAMWAEMKKHNIGVTSVHPGAIRTEMIQATLDNSDDRSAAQRNYEIAQKVGVSPQYCARRIIRAVQKNQLRIRVGADAVALDLLKRWFPVGIQKVLARIA